MITLGGCLSLANKQNRNTAQLCESAFSEGLRCTKVCFTLRKRAQSCLKKLVCEFISTLYVYSISYIQRERKPQVTNRQLARIITDICHDIRIKTTNYPYKNITPFKMQQQNDCIKTENTIHFHKKQVNKLSKSTLQKENNTEKETFSCQNEQ